MNKISKCASICSSLKIGNNNIIGKNVKIFENVSIGNNNKIYDNTIIYPNTKIGNNNIFLYRNKIGEIGVQSSFNTENFEFKYNGLEIGNNNFFHVDNIISNGYINKTIIGNNNKFLSEVYISHDNVIHDSVTFYPRVFSAGIVEYFNNSNIGANACIHQRCKIGNYSMIGMNSTITKNVFPFFIVINNKYIRINNKAIPDDFNINNYKEQLHKIIHYLYHNDNDNDNDCKLKQEINTLPKEILEIINNFLNKL
jgi:UDP-N-acetylglucosamine acyltransferase